MERPESTVSPLTPTPIAPAGLSSKLYILPQERVPREVVNPARFSSKFPVDAIPERLVPEVTLQIISPLEARLVIESTM